MDSTTVFWIIVAVFVLGAIVAAAAKAGRRSQLEKFVTSSVPDFTAHQHRVGADGKTALALDESKKLLCLAELSPTNQVAHRLIGYADVLSCEIHEDGVAVTKTSRSSQLGGALLGGLAFGGLGAVVGGLSGKRVSADKIRRIDLRLIVNDTAHPNFDLNFLDVETKQSGFLYKQAIEPARHWYGLVEVLIRQADQEAAPASPAQPTLAATSPSPTPTLHIADELRKLADLRTAGVLSDDEFNQQKAKLLAH